MFWNNLDSFNWQCVTCDGRDHQSQMLPQSLVQQERSRHIKTTVWAICRWEKWCVSCKPSLLKLNFHQLRKMIYLKMKSSVPKVAKEFETQNNCRRFGVFQPFSRLDYRIHIIFLIYIYLYSTWITHSLRIWDLSFT